MDGAELAQALGVAVDAASEAAELLREEFHRPGGPRGEGAHADVDARVETAISERLLRAYPTHGLLGEENGEQGARASRLRWVVDPNDGTAAYLKGERASAVSIGLLRDGVPVLGVVLAPLAPDDRGDLFTWCEGRALERNGVVVRVGERANELREGDVLALSGGAEHSVRANALWAHPARFLRTPSLAYRLALVAAGEAVGACGLGGPAAWDVAGGHALLRGAGCVLVNEQGAPWSYDARGHGAAFAGPAAIAERLRTSDWRGVLAPGQRDAEDPMRAYLPRVSMRGRTLREPGVLARAQGCLLGQLAGDALGGLVEFRSEASIASEYPDGVRELFDGGHWDTIAGQPTDDSEMALIAARTLVRDGAFEKAALLEAYRAWMHSRPFDMGMTTRAGLTGNPSETSQANGALMRVSSVALFGALRGEAQAAQWAREDASITHPHPACLDANAVFAVTVGHAVRAGASAPESYEFAVAYAERAGLHPLVREALRDARTGTPADYQSQQGWVRIALQNAFYQLVHAPDLNEGVVDTVRRGGDTDTNAAIAGALLGAVYGREAVPAQWRTSLACCRPVLPAGAVKGVWRPRPRVFWPTDAEALAEALVCAGRDAV